MIKKEKYDFDDFKKVMDMLLSENGCPWDKAQTHKSLERYLIEECYEVIDAIENGDCENLCEELGDVLLQVVFHSCIAEKYGEFSFDDIVDGICRKMIRRHSHIFADDFADTAEDVAANWEEIKKKEKGYSSYTEVLRNIPKFMPALMRAEKIQKKASETGFDFENFDGAFEKIREEADELLQAKNGINGSVLEEYGDLLFSVVNISRFLKLNPEFALTNASEKFINRFELIEDAARSVGRDVSELSLDEMDALWNNSKLRSAD